MDILPDTWQQDMVVRETVEVGSKGYKPRGVKKNYCLLAKDLVEKMCLSF